MIKRVIPVLFGVMLVAAMLPVQGQRRGLSEAQVTGNARTYTAEQTFDALTIPDCDATNHCASNNDIGRLCYYNDSDTSLRLSTCVCIAGDDPCMVRSLLTTTRFDLIASRTDTFGDELALGVTNGGTARDLTLTFDLDTDQTIIWDESADGFVFSKEVLPPSDDGQDLGDPQLRYSDVHATEGRFFCPGGPTSGAGATICYDPDDPEGPAWKLQIGGSTFYVQVSQTHP